MDDALNRVPWFLGRAFAFFQVAYSLCNCSASFKLEVRHFSGLGLPTAVYCLAKPDIHEKSCQDEDIHAVDNEGKIQAERFIARRQECFGDSRAYGEVSFDDLPRVALEQ